MTELFSLNIPSYFSCKNAFFSGVITLAMYLRSRVVWLIVCSFVLKSVTAGNLPESGHFKKVIEASYVSLNNSQVFLYWVAKAS